MNRRKLNLPILGFIVLTASLMLVFAVCIVGAVTHSGYGNSAPIDQVYYSISVWNLMYDAGTKITSSEHSLSLYNGEAATINYEYEFKHALSDIGGYENTIWVPGQTLGPGNTFNRYSKQLMSVNSAPVGQHTLNCYTRVGFSRSGQGFGDTAPDSLLFNR